MRQKKRHSGRDIPQDVSRPVSGVLRTEAESQEMVSKSYCLNFTPAPQVAQLLFGGGLLEETFMGTSGLENRGVLKRKRFDSSLPPG